MKSLSSILILALRVSTLLVLALVNQIDYLLHCFTTGSGVMFPNIPPSELRKHQFSKSTLTLSIVATDNILIRGSHSLGHIACTNIWVSFIAIILANMNT